MGPLHRHSSHSAWRGVYLEACVPGGVCTWRRVYLEACVPGGVCAWRRVCLEARVPLLARSVVAVLIQQLQQGASRRPRWGVK